VITVQGLLHVAGINSFASMYGAKSTPAQNEKAQELTSAFRSNLAAVYIKQERWEQAIYATSKVLEVDPDNLKARYRRSLAYLRNKQSQQAAADLDLALAKAPNDPSIRRLAMELVEQEEDRLDKIKEAEAAKAEAEENKKRQEEEAARNVR
jgi:regulator of sirC expression with transglutaminase-like and TPR domain